MNIEHGLDLATDALKEIALCEKEAVKEDYLERDFYELFSNIKSKFSDDLLNVRELRDEILSKHFEKPNDWDTLNAKKTAIMNQTVQMAHINVNTSLHIFLLDSKLRQVCLWSEMLKADHLSNQILFEKLKRSKSVERMPTVDDNSNESIEKQPEFLQDYSKEEQVLDQVSQLLLDAIKVLDLKRTLALSESFIQYTWRNSVSLQRRYYTSKIGSLLESLDELSSKSL